MIIFIFAVVLLVAYAWRIDKLPLYKKCPKCSKHWTLYYDHTSYSAIEIFKCKKCNNSTY